MRENLKDMEGERQTYTGIFERVGSKMDDRGAPVTTVVLTDIRDAKGNVVTDHVWLNRTQGFKSLGWLTPGDIIQFDGRIKRYGKDLRYDDDGVCRYHGYDYGFTYPTKLRKLDKK